MTVKELIEALSACAQDATVVMGKDRDRCLVEVTEVFAPGDVGTSYLSLQPKPFVCIQ